MNEQQKKDVERIRIRYQSETEEAKKLNELKRLDKEVENALLIPSLTIGILGSLVLGCGMSLIMVYGDRVPGIIIGIAGIIILAVSFPIGKYFQQRKAKELKGRINTLCDEIL